MGYGGSGVDGVGVRGGGRGRERERGHKHKHQAMLGKSTLVGFAPSCPSTTANTYFTEMGSGSEAGSYFKLTLGLRVLKKKGGEKKKNKIDICDSRPVHDSEILRQLSWKLLPKIFLHPAP